MRIICFGCSLTYGEGITEDDCGLFKNPSKYSWPSILDRDILNNTAEVINESWPGASNKLILYKLMNFDFEDSDVVCIQYTYSGRDSLFFNEIKQATDCNYFHVINPATAITPTSLSIKYYEIYDNYNLLVNDLIYINSAYEFLQNKKLKHICRFASRNKILMGFEDCKFKNNHQFNIDEQLETIYDISNKVSIENRFGHDGQHFSIDVNRLIAEEYYRSITNMV